MIRTLQTLVVAAVPVAFLVLVSGGRGAEEIRASKFTVVDEKGEPRVEIGTTRESAGITIHSPADDSKLTISLDLNGILCEYEPTRGASVMLYSTAGGGLFQSFNFGKDNTGKIHIGVADDGVPIMSARDKDGVLVNVIKKR